ncbi:MAG: hypothetical protein JRG73_21110, partial [Deltaproteobacteria bacterium]|nr:hypothetical protein [Deltaproteobacteria bacterium]
KGTPQGGVISPLLSNLYLHYFDKVFHKPNGPAHWANTLVTGMPNKDSLYPLQYVDSKSSKRKPAGVKAALYRRG